MSHKGIFEDSSDDFESESGEDFSASEDEWKPGKDDHVSDEDDFENVGNSSEDISDDEDGSSSSKKRAKKSKGKAPKKINKAPKLNASSKNRQSSQSLRSKLFRRYNPPPKTTSKSPVPAKVADILSNSQYTARKQMSLSDKKPNPAAVFSDSDSSDDDGLVRPSQLDFNSEFFDVKATTKNGQAESSAPVFDCNAGMNLSDSSDDDANEFDEVAPDTNSDTSKKPSIINKINSKSSTEMHDFSSLHNFTKNLESAKAQLEKLKDKELIASTSKIDADESDITKLLSLGEGAATISSGTGRKRKHKDGQHSDDSDWENVSDNDDGSEIKDIQITVGSSSVGRGMTREQKKAIDVEACLKRRLNRDIKQKQIWLHKSSVLCWIAHGNYINRILNNLTLMEMCIKLLPSRNAYPKGDTDVKYYHMITDWFHTLFQLKSEKLYCPLKKLPPKTLSLALQIQSKKIISKCDYVLLFVTMLRSLGIQCRLVINFAVPPQQPPQKDLFVISTKPKETEDVKSNSNTKDDKKSLAKKIKVSAEKVKQFSKDEPSTSTIKEKGEKVKQSVAKTTKVSKSKNSKETEHSYAERSPSKMKLPDSKSIKSPIKSPKPKTSSNGNDPDADKPFEKVKVKLSRMSESFVEKATAGPTKKRTDDSKKNTVKQLSQSQSSQSKRSKDIDEDNNNATKYNNQHISNNRSRAKKVDNAEASHESPTSSNTKQSNEKLHANKTPGIHKLVERTNSIDKKPKLRPNEVKESIKEEISKNNTFSPRKTRSRASKIAVVAAQTKAKSKLKLPQLDGAHDDNLKDKKRAKAKLSAKSRAKHDDSGSDSDFAPAPQKRIRAKITPQKPIHKALTKTKQIDCRVFSTDDENDADANTIKMNFWVEAYAEKEKKWIVIDPVKRKADCIDHVRKHASKPIIYVLAWNNDNTIRDVTPRYCSQFHTTTRKLRAEQLWIDDALEQYIEQRNPRTIIEDVEFSKLHMDTPMPTSINEFKNHPLYALERHLLKFEAIYPPNALTLGYIRNEPVYARDCVHTLHSREIWVKQARTVKVGEKPYKIVKARPKWNRMLNQMEEAKPLEIFGFWQTEPYQPPVAENGLVPRNAYGNVELFKPEMLPIGTRHIQLPNLNRICKKMGVDCAQAVIGFDFHGGSSHPTFDGFVVCEEFADDVIKQWEVEQEEQIRKEHEKREARVFGNWKKLIKGLLIRERLKRKFNFGVEQSPEKSHGGKRKK